MCILFVINQPAKVAVHMDKFTNYMGCDVSKFARKVGQASQPLHPSNSTLVNPLNVQHDESEEGKDKDNNVQKLKFELKRQSTLDFLAQMSAEARNSVSRRTTSRMENEYDYCIGGMALIIYFLNTSLCSHIYHTTSFKCRKGY